MASAGIFYFCILGMHRTSMLYWSLVPPHAQARASALSQKFVSFPPCWFRPSFSCMVHKTNPLFTRISFNTRIPPSIIYHHRAFSPSVSFLLHFLLSILHRPFLLPIPYNLAHITYLGCKCLCMSFYLGIADVDGGSGNNKRALQVESIAMWY